MAETQNAKSETFERERSGTTVKNGNESIDDSGIEMSVEDKGKFETNLALDCPWILGQLAWARGSSYPFWPCVVTQDPKTLLYYKVQKKGRAQLLMVHVQYFGDGGRHNWVLSHYMIPFLGLDDFKNRANSISAEKKKKDPKCVAAFSPKLGVKKQWGIGVIEATGLMHLSNEERACMFEPVAPQPVQTAQAAQPTNKLKRKLSTRGSKNSSETPTPGPKKFKKSENEDQAMKSVSSSEPILVTASKLETESASSKSTSIPDKESNKNIMVSTRRKSTRNKNKNLSGTVDVPKRQNMRKKVLKLSDEERKRRDDIDFEDYYNLNKDFWKTDHPEATDGEILKLLRDIWDDMDAEEKNNNLNRNFNEYRYNLIKDQPEVKHLQQTNLKQKTEKSKNAEMSLQRIQRNKSKFSDENNKDSINNSPKNGNYIQASKTNDIPKKENDNANSEFKNNSKAEKGNENYKIGVISQNEKSGDSKVKGSSQENFKKENLKVFKENFQKKNSNTSSESKDNFKGEKGEENSKTEVVSQNGRSSNLEMKDNTQEDFGKKNLKCFKPSLHRENSQNISERKDNLKDKKSDENSKTEVVSQNKKSDDSETKGSPKKDLEKENLTQNGSLETAEEEKIEKVILEMSKNTTETRVKSAEGDEKFANNKMEVQKADQTDQKKCTHF